MRSSPACSSGVSCRTTFAGVPSASTPGGISRPSAMSDPAPRIEPAPTFAPFSSTAFMPIRLPSQTSQPCSITLCPMVTFAPSTSGLPGSACSTEPSCTLVHSPMVISSLSPRMTTLNQTFAWRPRTTEPMTAAVGAMYQSPAGNRGCLSFSEYRGIRAEILRTILTSAFMNMKESDSIFVEVRGLRYHVRSWGREGAPRMFLLHGWMDVSASFQFVVDALRRDWHVLAPDWRGFGLSAWTGADTYWYPDYLADLDRLLERFEPAAPARIVGHSMGGNIACLYAGVRPD